MPCILLKQDKPTSLVSVCPDRSSSRLTSLRRAERERKEGELERKASEFLTHLKETKGNNREY